MSNHFAFTKLVVADLEASAAFYTSVFGIEELARVSAQIGPRPIDEIMFKPTAPGGGSFVLLRYGGTTRPSADEIIIGFIVPDVDAAIERAVAAGGSVVDPARDMPEHRIRVGFVTDPEGHVIELVQQVQDG